MFNNMQIGGEGMCSRCGERTNGAYIHKCRGAKPNQRLLTEFKDGKFEEIESDGAKLLREFFKYKNGE